MAGPPRAGHAALALHPLPPLAISAYQEASGRYDAEIAYRVDRYWKMRAPGGTAFSIEHESVAEVLDQIRKLREIFFGP